MLQIKTSNPFNHNQLNFLFCTRIALELVSQYSNKIDQLLEIGIVFDPAFMGIELNLLSKCLFISPRLLELSVRRQIKTEIVTVTDANSTKEFRKILVKRNGQQMWKFFSIPGTPDGNLILQSIQMNKCAFSTVLFTHPIKMIPFFPTAPSMSESTPYIREKYPNVYNKDYLSHMPRKIELQKATPFLQKPKYYSGIIRMNVFLPDYVVRLGHENDIQLPEILPSTKTTWTPFQHD